MEIEDEEEWEETPQDLEEHVFALIKNVNTKLLIS
jgi:hypothetical protein